MVSARQIASYTAFPLILGSSIGATLWLAPSLGVAAAILVTQPLAILAIIFGERLLPYNPSWNRSHGDLRTDICHVIVSGISTGQLMQPFAIFLGSIGAGLLAPALSLGIWPSDWPLVAQLALALVVAELPQYWVHRWEHERDILWRFHATHHSAPRLYWLNAARFHPVDLGLLYLVGYVPLVLLGCPRDVILLFGLFDAVFGMLQHCNIDVRLGPLNYIFSMAEPHRWHHSRTLTEANTNYGSNLILWDLVFGTFFLPDRHPPIDIGIADLPHFPQSYLAQLASPFRWKAIRAQDSTAA